MNKVKQKLKKRHYTIGSWVQLPEPGIVEIMAKSGFEWLVIDMEHGSISIETLPDLFRAMESANCLPLVRIPENNGTTIKRVLDAGAKGLVVPRVDYKEDAERAIRAAKYPPEGERGVGFSHANLYGAEFAEYVKRINDELIIVLQIEHIRSVENIDEILSVPGIDACMIGPYDLSGSMNLTGQFKHPEFQKTVRRVLECAKRHDIAMGTHVVPPDIEELKRRIEEGYSFIAYSLDTVLLANICRKAMKEIGKISK